MRLDEDCKASKMLKLPRTRAAAAVWTASVICSGRHPAFWHALPCFTDMVWQEHDTSVMSCTAGARFDLL